MSAARLSPRARGGLLALVVVAGGLAGWLVPWPAQVRDQLPDLFAELPANLGGHMLLSVAALAVGLLISLPLGVYVSARPRRAELTLGLASVLQTIPSLALLALMVPLLGGNIGFKPAFAAMVLYSLLPILKNTVIGIQGVDLTLVEAAKGLGMDDRQVLFGVQLPLARPVILSGIRVATVLVVGSATLATPVGCRTLGNYIFTGLVTHNYFEVIFGCAMAALLAIVFDQLIRMVEVALDRGSRRLLWTAVAGLLLLIAGGLYRPVTQALNPPANPITLGTHNYTEQYILGTALNDRLARAGYDVKWRDGMAQLVTLDAVCRGEVDVCVDYTGTIWTNLMKRDRPGTRDETLREVTTFMDAEYGVECLGPLGFENAYKLAMRRDQAEKLNIKSMNDLRPLAREMKIAGDLQFFRQPEWLHARQIYGLAFPEPLSMEASLMYGAVRDGEVDIIAAYSTDGRIKAYDLVILDDPQQGLPPYDAVILLSKKARRQPALRQALLPLVRAITRDRMTDANKRVDIDRSWPKKAGRELLADLQEQARGGQ